MVEKEHVSGHLKKKNRLIYFSSSFANAPNKKKAEEKVKYWEGRIHNGRVTITNWSGGKTGDSYGKNYWFDGYVESKDG